MFETYSGGGAGGAAGAAGFSPAVFGSPDGLFGSPGLPVVFASAWPVFDPAALPTAAPTVPVVPLAPASAWFCCAKFDDCACTSCVAAVGSTVGTVVVTPAPVCPAPAWACDAAVNSRKYTNLLVCMSAFDRERGN